MLQQRKIRLIMLIIMKFSLPLIGHTFENNIKYFLFSSFICYVKYILGYPGFGGEVGAPGWIKPISSIYSKIHSINIIRHARTEGVHKHTSTKRKF